MKLKIDVKQGTKQMFTAQVWRTSPVTQERNLWDSFVGMYRNEIDAHDAVKRLVMGFKNIHGGKFEYALKAR